MTTCLNSELDGVLLGKSAASPQMAWRLRLLMAAWTAGTSADPVAWSVENPAWGQCAATACVVHDLFGDALVWGEAKLPDGRTISHYWNRVAGQDIDITRRQFPLGTILTPGVPKLQGHDSIRHYVLSLPATPGVPKLQGHDSIRHYVLSLPATLARYETLRAAFERLVEIEHFRTLLALARTSPDRSTKIGCVVANPMGKVLATGVNRFTRAMQPDERHHARPAKYLFTEHAERCAFYAAARAGVSLAGGTIFVRGIPCADCARGVVETGLRCVVTSGTVLNGRWEASQEASYEMLREAGVEVRISGVLPIDLMEDLRNLAVDAPQPALREVAA